jgi:uncharacterized alkaline shock family protein YloU
MSDVLDAWWRVFHETLQPELHARHKEIAMTDVQRTNEAARSNADAPSRDPQGKLIIHNDVVAKIAGMAAREVAGVSPSSTGLLENIQNMAGGGDSNVKRGVKAEVGERQAAFDLSFVVDWGYHIPSVAAEVRRKVTQRVEEMTGLETTEINVEITDISFDEQHARVE